MVLFTTFCSNIHVKYYNTIHVTMPEKKQFSVPVTLERLLKFNIECKVSGKNQEEVFADLIDKHIPDRGLNLKVM